MNILWLLIVLQIAILIAWCGGMIWVSRLRADAGMTLDPIPGPPIDGPPLTILIAAHNEEERIESCLRRLLAQNYPNLHIKVVNDRSEDRTAERVRAVMADDPRVSLQTIHELPDGWTGKTHALARAVRGVTTEYLLFTDCDCRMVPGALAAVMRKVTQEKIEFVTLWPRLELLSPSERLLTPAASWLLGVWGLIRSFRAESNSQVELGNGQFMLFRREAYERIGGHAGVRSELAEDLILAKKVAAAGYRRWAGLGKGLYVTSRDNTNSQTFNSLTRVFIGSLLRPWRLAVSTQLLLGGVCSPVFFLPIALFWGLAGGPVETLLHAAVCAAHLLVMRFVVRRLLALTIESPPSFGSFLWGAIGCIGIVFSALLIICGRGQVRWGKTSYRVRGSQIVATVPAR